MFLICVCQSYQDWFVSDISDESMKPSLCLEMEAAKIFDRSSALDLLDKWDKLNAYLLPVV